MLIPSLPSMCGRMWIFGLSSAGCVFPTRGAWNQLSSPIPAQPPQYLCLLTVFYSLTPRFWRFLPRAHQFSELPLLYSLILLGLPTISFSCATRLFTPWTDVVSTALWHRWQAQTLTAEETWTAAFWCVRCLGHYIPSDSSFWPYWNRGCSSSRLLGDDWLSQFWAPPLWPDMPCLPIPVCHTAWRHFYLLWMLLAMPLSLVGSQGLPGPDGTDRVCPWAQEPSLQLKINWLQLM